MGAPPEEGKITPKGTEAVLPEVTYQFNYINTYQVPGMGLEGV